MTTGIEIRTRDGVLMAVAVGRRRMALAAADVLRDYQGSPVELGARIPVSAWMTDSGDDLRVEDGVVYIMSVRGAKLMVGEAR